MSKTIGSMLLLAASLANAFTPYTPNTVVEGNTMSIKWEADSSPDWKSTKIELMSGPNQNMVPMLTVAEEVDCGASDSLEFDVPLVNPNAAIYFFQFSMNGTVSADTTRWTSRFAIASQDGEVTDPPNATQPEGDEIPWGTGELEGEDDDGDSDSSASGAASASPSISDSGSSAPASGAASGVASGAVSGSASGAASYSGVVPVHTGGEEGNNGKPSNCNAGGHQSITRSRSTPGATTTATNDNDNAAEPTETESDYNLSGSAGTSVADEPSSSDVPTGDAVTNAVRVSFVGLASLAATFVFFL